MASPISLLLPLLAQLGGVQWGDHEPFERPAGSELRDMLGNIGDWDGDGFDEIAMAVEATNELHIVSSATRQTLQILDVQARFGEPGQASKIVRMGDLNGDGVEEFVFAFKRDRNWEQLYHFSVEVYRGSLHLVDGATLTPLWTLYGDEVRRRLGHVIQKVPDRDGDGLADLLVSAPSMARGRESVGYVTFISTRTAQVIDQLTRAGVGAAFGEGALLGDDINGDGAPDLIASAPAWGTPRNVGRLYAIDLESRQDIWVVQGPLAGMGPGPDCVGRWMLPADDLDGDGLTDFFMGSKNYRWLPDGIVQAISAASGAVLWSAERSIRHYSGDRSWGALCVVTPDLDGDGMREVIARHHQHGGTLEILSGRTGELIAATGWWGSRWGVGTGWYEDHSSVVEIQDLNGDSFPEYITMLEHPGELGYPNARTMSFFPGLVANTTTISRSSGTVVEMELAFPWQQADLHYVIAASSTGTTGGPFRSIDLPLDQDALFARSKNPATPLFPGQWGQLDANGRASITIDTTGLLSRFAASQLHFSAVVYSASNSHPKVASRAWTFDIAP